MAVIDRIDRARCAPLPRPDTAAGAPRRVGVEIEFGGLTETEAAEVAEATLAGRLVRQSAHDLTLEESRLGRLRIYLDTAWRDLAGNALADFGLDLGRAVVPVEIVTEPLDVADLADLDRLRDALRRAGAAGSREGVFLGFGLHLNPEIPGPRVEDILPVTRAYALMEDWLRYADPIDPSRRILPFADPYPRSLVDRLAADAPGWSRGTFMDIYLHESPTRDRGLDMLPVFRHLDGARVDAALGQVDAISARPTFHYRLPDSRIDDPDWTVAYEWNRWIMVERLAADATLLERLARQWGEYRGALTTARPDWLDHLERFADRHLVPEPA